MKKRYKITLEYDGTYYCGWQKQKDLLSVQEALEIAIQSFSNKKTKVVGAGRTDADVHALGQVAHFDLDSDFDAYKIMAAMNHYLRQQCLDRNAAFQKILKDNHEQDLVNKLLQQISFPIQNIVVLNCEIVDEDFHSRFSAKKRFYKYRILDQKHLTVIRKNCVWEIYETLDLGRIQQAAEYLIGTHDFSSFRDSECQAKSPIRTLDGIKIYKENDEIIFEVWAKSFLHHMVRNIVGTLRDVGSGKISVEEFKQILEVKDRTKAGKTAPGYGLYFVRVEY